MQASSQVVRLNRKLIFGVVAIVAAISLIVSLLSPIARASSIVHVTSNIADVPGGESLVLTVGVQDDGDVYELEVDHSMETTIPEFSVYADEADPYGGDGAQFAALGASVTYSASAGQWVISFGDGLTQDILDNGGDIRFYLALRDVSGNYLWGSMNQVTPENTFGYDLAEGTGDSLVADETDATDGEEGAEEDSIVPGVPNTSVVL